MAESGISTLEYHVLLAMASGPLYGYAIKEAVEAESQGAVTPRAGSLYRVIGRLMSRGIVREATPQGDVEAHPGRARKYYALTTEGRAALSAEAQRLQAVAALARRRLRTAGGRS
jgi:DNA-binding PadR family transcriptional regulator